MVSKVKNSIFRPSKKALITAKILGVSLVSTSTSSVLKEICRRVEGKAKTFIVTPNPEFLVFASKHPWFKQVLNSADIALPDGIGLVWLAGLKERIAGTDLMEKLCALCAKKSWSVYLLGGAPGVAGAAAAKLKTQNSKLKIWANSGPQHLESADIRNVVDEINKKQPTFLFVAFGMGKQEKFIADNWEKLQIKLAMGVGGAFDYLSGRVARAPKWLQWLGLEWLYRLFQEPWRARRQLALLEFIWLVIREKFDRKTS